MELNPPYGPRQHHSWTQRNCVEIASPCARSAPTTPSPGRVIAIAADWRNVLPPSIGKTIPNEKRMQNGYS